MTSISNSARALGGPLDLGVAALAAVSVGFVTFAMPEALFSSLVTATRLPELLAAAARPSETEEPGKADSIGSLMNRLERGLVEREEPRPAPLAEPDLPEALAAASADPEASLSPEGVRHRLRSAISELNQRASRG